MPIANVSNKGQITLPATERRRLGITPNSKVEIVVRGDEIVIRPLQPLSELRGAFRHCVTDGPMEWETTRESAGRAVAKQVADE